MGEFGFAKLLEERKKLLESWRADENKTVQWFASDRIHKLDVEIAAENRAAEALIARRRLDYGENLDGS